MLNSKDAALAFAARSLLNTRLQAIGEIGDLSVDTAGRRAQLRLSLRGEPEEIHLDIRRYDVERTEAGDWLVVAEAVASREWVTAALQQFVVGRRFHIPSKAATVLRLLT
jgi:hypothetical protein